MSIAPGARKRIRGQKLEHAELLPPRELRGIIESVLRLAKSTVASETEVQVDEVADALTRFANNGIHQNVFEHCVTVSVRTVTDGRKGIAYLREHYVPALIADALDGEPRPDARAVDPPTLLAR